MGGERQNIRSSGKALANNIRTSATPSGGASGQYTLSYWGRASSLIGARECIIGGVHHRRRQLITTPLGFAGVVVGFGRYRSRPHYIRHRRRLRLHLRRGDCAVDDDDVLGGGMMEEDDGGGGCYGRRLLS